MNPTPVIPATPTATKTPPRWISWIWSWVVLFVVAPIAYSEPQESVLNVSVTGKMQIGCMLTIIVESKCNELLQTPTVIFDGAKVEMEGDGQSKFVGYVTTESSGVKLYSAYNTCRRITGKSTIKGVSIGKSVDFMDPAVIPGSSIRVVNVIKLRLTRSTASNTKINYIYDLCLDPFDHIDAEVVLPTSGARSDLLPGSSQVPTLETKRIIDSTGMNPDGWTGWARYVNISWSADCESFLNAVQPKIW